MTQELQEIAVVCLLLAGTVGGCVYDEAQLRGAVGTGGIPSTGGGGTAVVMATGGQTSATGGATGSGRTRGTGSAANVGGTTGPGGGSATGGAAGSGGTVSRTPAVAKAISAGLVHTCAVLDSGTIWCWGRNDQGQLGNGTTASSSVPVVVSGITDAVAVSAGGLHACALVGGGKVRCWGSNSSGILGSGTSSASSSVPITVSGVANAVAVSDGGVHACAVLSGGTVECWGDNLKGELGSSTTTAKSTVPVAVSGMSTAVAYDAGTQLGCAVLSSGTVQCWGYNFMGQLGNGTTTNGPVPVPVTVKGITDAVGVSAGSWHACAVLRSGAVQCWGWNGHGELGDGTSTDSSTPVAVTGITNAVAVSVGCGDSGSHTCALLNAGAVQCWGAGVLGDGTATGSYVPVTVSGITNAAAVAAGYSHTCVLLSGGTVQCWGRNGGYGPLGNGSTTDSLVPVTVSGF
jgi:alpha-tubulin suppressor-like RCC1 family protein